MRFRNFVQHWLLPLGMGGMGVACRGAPPAAHDPAGPATAAVALLGSALPARAEAVTSADAWAVQGAKMGGREGAQRLLDAAELRQRTFRVDHREADALEAIELYRQAAQTDRALRCAALTSAATLEGELHADPAATFQAVYRAEHAPDADPPCKARAEAILVTLGAYRPL